MMATRVCECGFANKDNAVVCAFCGAPLEAPIATSMASSLILANEGEASQPCIIIQAPGGIVGRAGDYSPEVFSERVSAIHANISFVEGSWGIEHMGRNASYILRAGERISLPIGHKVDLLPGDKLLLADMVFNVSIENRTNECDSGEYVAADNQDSRIDGASPVVKWIITCPVCGTSFDVENEDSRLDVCSNCLDPFDKKRIANSRPERVS